MGHPKHFVLFLWCRYLCCGK